MFDKKPETRRLYDALDGKPRGTQYSVSELERILGGIRADGSGSPGYRIFYRVAKSIEFNSGGVLCWRWIRGDNVYRCLSNDQLPTDVKGRTNGIRRRARRNVMIGNAIEMADFTLEQQKEIQVLCTINGMIHAMAQRRNIDRLVKHTPQVVVPDLDGIMSLVRQRTKVVTK